MRSRNGRSVKPDSRASGPPADKGKKPAAEAKAPGKTQGTLTMLGGHRIPADGDLLQIVECLFREVAARKQFQHTYHDMKSEIEGLVGQMTEAQRRTYLVESLFLNSVTYENEMIDSFLKKLEQAGGRKGPAS